MNISLQPSSNKKSQKHYRDTVQKKVSLDDIKDTIRKADYEYLYLNIDEFKVFDSQIENLLKY